MSHRGIETLVAANPTSDSLSVKTALSLLFGFAFMLLVEKFSSEHGHEHGHSHSRTPSMSASTTLFALPDEADKHSDTPSATNDGNEFDVALSELEAHEGMALAGTSSNANGDMTSHPSSSRANGIGIISMHERQAMNATSSRKKAFPLTFGLVIHSLADGLALGASALPRSGGDGEGGSSQLSIVVFLAIVVHKGKLVTASGCLVY